MNEAEILFPALRTAVALPQSRPAVSDGEVLVRTEKSLVSPGTELSFFEGTHIGFANPANTWVKYPFRPGYAAIGEVVEAGAAVESPRVGERIFFFGRHARWNLLDPARVWVAVPPDVPDDAVLLSRLVQIAATGVVVLRRPPESAIVVGAGLVGLFAAQFLQARGCRRVVVQDVLPSRLELARRNGLALTALATGPGLEAAQAVLGSEPPDCVIEATGIAAMAAPSLQAVKAGGDTVLLGIPRGEATLNLYDLIVRKNAALLGAHEGMIPDRAPAGTTSRLGLIEAALAGMRGGSIRTEGLVTGQVKPGDCQGVYEELSRNKAGWVTAVLDWD